MTFAELAQARGTSKRAAVVLVRRHGWRKQRNNAGHVLALVPPTWAAPVAGDVTKHEGNERDGHNAGHSASTFTVSLAEAHRRADAALALADRTMAQLADAGERADAANRRADAAEVRADHADKRADAAEARAEANIQRADRAEKLAEAAEARSDVNIQRADRADARADQERLAADRFRGEAEAARGELAQAVERRTAAEVEARGLREAENERQQLGRWRRAWRGWRGR